MNIKFIPMPFAKSAKNAIDSFNSLGWNCIKFSVDRRYLQKQKVIEVIRNHPKYRKTMTDTLLFEGMISIMNQKDFWIGKPDFLIWNKTELYFCEYKSVNDVWRVNQLEWFERFDMLPTAIAVAVSDKKHKEVS